MSYHHTMIGGFIIDELCYIISCMITIMTPKRKWDVEVYPSSPIRWFHPGWFHFMLRILIRTRPVIIDYKSMSSSWYYHKDSWMAFNFPLSWYLNVWWHKMGGPQQREDPSCCEALIRSCKVWRKSWKPWKGLENLEMVFKTLKRSATAC